jgi:hypothetical protein
MSTQEEGRVAGLQDLPNGMYGDGEVFILETSKALSP